MSSSPKIDQVQKLIDSKTSKYDENWVKNRLGDLYLNIEDLESSEDRELEQIISLLLYKS